jgi:hypothetical protein
MEEGISNHLGHIHFCASLVITIPNFITFDAVSLHKKLQHI